MVWTEDTFKQAFSVLMKTGTKWDDSAHDYPQELMVQQLADAGQYTYELGDWEGLVMFYPINPGRDASVHWYIWGPRFMRRPALMRAILRDAMDTWDLERVVEIVPSRNTLGCRNAEAIGFTKEGVLRKQVWYNNGEGRDDMVVYGILREDL